MKQWAKEELSVSLFEEDIISIKLSELKNCGTMCGTLENKCFTPLVIWFLRLNLVNKIYAKVYNDDHRIITAAVIKLGWLRSLLFCKMIEKCGGGFRPEQIYNKSKGRYRFFYTSFESE